MCPVPPGPTQGGIGAAHGSPKRFGGSIGVAGDPSNNSWRYWGVPMTRETTLREYWGITWLHNQTRGKMPAGMYIA